MNTDTGPLARMALTAGIVLLAAACGSGSAPPVSSSARSIYVQSLAYAECMHAHGAPEFPGPELEPEGSLVQPLAPPHGMLSSPGYDRAFRACEHLAPVSGGLTGTRKAMVDRRLTAAACMRAHGIAGYPDPATIDGGIHDPDLWVIGVDAHTPQFAAAVDACKAGDFWVDEWSWPAGSLGSADS
jgi:hypothetical protein